MGIGENIKRIRKKRGLTQKKLGELCGIAESNIRKYESGKQNPKYETLQKIADVLNVHVLYLRDELPLEISNNIMDNSITEEAAFMTIYKLIYGNIDIVLHTSSGVQYALGTENNIINISALTYDNIIDAVETLIQKYVYISTKYNNSQECLSLIQEIEKMDIDDIKKLISYATFLNTQREENK